MFEPCSWEAGGDGQAYFGVLHILSALHPFLPEVDSRHLVTYLHARRHLESVMLTSMAAGEKRVVR